MTTSTLDSDDSTNPSREAWGAVFSMSLCVAMLIASEFMPVSLLTPMAAGLGATEGAIGQAISVSGFSAVVASLLITTVAGRLNRKWILVAMTVCMMLSLVMVAMAMNFTILMLARILLGICVGGFWSLGTAVIMRLVSPERVSKALAVMYTGQAMSAAFAAPIGSYLGGMIGWRGVFWVLVPIVIVNIIWQLVSLPSLPADRQMSFRSLFALLKRPHFARGLLAVIFMFSGAFSMFTYLRPFLESEVGVSVNTLSLLFLVLGGAGFLGTWAGGRFAHQHAIRMLQVVSLTMAVVTLGLLGFGQSLLWVAVLLALWGAMNTALSIGWMAWLSQNIDDAPEAAGSLIVATIQAAILCGAALGGGLLDRWGIEVTFITSAALSLLALCLVGSGRGILKPEAL